MKRDRHACLCGFQSDHPGICPTCREEMYRVGDAWLPQPGAILSAIPTPLAAKAEKRW